ncbi:MAG TPA: hypothetical protein VFK33_11890 [Bacillales bacterium]|nr:hypothetical protein [Bacillales bacterium]
MNHVWMIGPFMIKEIWLVEFITGLAAYIALKYIIAVRSIDRGVLDSLWNAFLLFIVIWKFSYTLFHLFHVIEQPMSQLYFTGADKGIFLAFAGVAIYFIRLSQKTLIPFKNYIEIGFIALFLVLGLYHLIETLYGIGFIQSILQVFLAAILLAYWLLKTNEDGKRTLWPILMVWFCLGEFFLTYFGNPVPVLFSFSYNQLGLILGSILGIIALYKKT